MPDPDIVTLQRAVTQLNSIKASIAEVSALNDLHVQRYLELKSLMVAIDVRLNTLELWVTNHVTGNAI